jgi:hypothetical protein
MNTIFFEEKKKLTRFPRWWRLLIYNRPGLFTRLYQYQNIPKY